MSKFSEALTRELLHVTRREWPRTIDRRTAEAKQTIFCSYCGHETDLGGLTQEQRATVLLDHIVACDKRPEMKFVNVALAAEKLFDHCGAGDEDAFAEAMCSLRDELDRLKQPRGEV